METRIFIFRGIFFFSKTFEKVYGNKNFQLRSISAAAAHYKQRFTFPSDGKQMDSRDYSQGNSTFYTKPARGGGGGAG